MRIMHRIAALEQSNVSDVAFNTGVGAVQRQLPKPDIGFVRAAIKSALRTVM